MSAELQSDAIQLKSSAVAARLGHKELALHCRRTTRGVEETKRLIFDLISALDGDNGKDTMGVPLFNHELIQEIWKQQQKHIQCIQDPPGIQLYTKTGVLTKGGIVLPTYRCARGSTSLESFHLHLNRFIPGTAASDVHFQAYLLEGLVRWNSDRATAAVAGNSGDDGNYSDQLKAAVNRLSMKVFGNEPYGSFRPADKYTGIIISSFTIFLTSVMHEAYLHILQRCIHMIGFSPLLVCFVIRL